MIKLSTFEAFGSKGSITYLVGPARARRSRGLLVVVHGHSRSALRLPEAFLEKAYDEGLTVLAPVFDIESYGSYQTLRGQAGPLAAADALDLACNDVLQRLSIRARPFTLFGFSAGAQFAHRYAMLRPKNVGVLVIASAGWYTTPNPDLAFPSGLAQSASMPTGLQNLAEFLEIPTLVMVGERDVQRDHNLRMSPAIDEQQGLNRLERASRWVKAVTLRAMDLGASPRVSLDILPNTGHSASQAIRNGSLVQRSLRFIVDHWR